MTEQPKTVVCASCNAKFHVPDELIRGKLVKFRCRKCGSAIDVDGRRSARPLDEPILPPPSTDVTAVDTPATFSQRTLPPPRPPAVLSKSSPNLHPWPEPPRTRTTTAPIAMPTESAPPEESVPRLENVRDPSNRGPKIAAIVSLLIAAGLSGFGLAMRGAPSGPVSASAGDTHGAERGASPSDPNAAQARAAAEPKADEPHQATRTPARVTDLPHAVDGVPPSGAAAAKPGEVVPEQQEAANTGGATTHGTAARGAAPNAAEGTAPAAGATEAPTSVGAGAAEPGGVHAPSTAPNATPPSVTAVPPGAAPQPGANTPAPPVAAPAPASRGKGDFNTQAAREALEDAAGRAGKCRNIDTPSGTARVAVTFAPTGHATHAVIESGPFVGTAAGSCVAGKFRSARVPPFSGDAVTVRKSVPF